MNRIFIIVTIVFVALSFSSCKSNVSSRMTSFVTKLDNNYTTYSKEDWTKAKSKFKSLYDEYKEVKDSLTTDQRREANTAIVKYLTICVKDDAETVVNLVKTISKEIPEIIETMEPLLPILALVGLPLGL